MYSGVGTHPQTWDLPGMSIQGKYLKGAYPGLTT